MKNLILIFFVLFSISLSAQTNNEKIVKKWKLHKTEEFGQVYDLLDSQKNDQLTFTKDGKFTGIIEGKEVAGFWSVGKTVIVKIDNLASKIKINRTKVILLTNDKFILEYQNGDLITARLIFIAVH